MKDPVKRLAAALAAVFVLTVLVYSGSLSDKLLWDDSTFVKGNSFIRDCSNLKTALNPVYLVKVLPVKMGSRPLVNVSLLLDTCSGTGPMGMRVTNLLLHASNAVLAATLAYVFTGAVLPAAAAGLIFGLHPAAAEAVAVVTFRSHLLCAFFYLSALLTGLLYIREKKRFYLAASLLLALCSMLSNEVGITFPLAFAFLLWTAEKPRAAFKRNAAVYLAACVLISAAYFWFRLPRGSYEIPGVAHFGYEGVGFLYPDKISGEAPKAPFVMPENAEIVKLPDGLPPLPKDAREVFSAAPWNVIHSDPRLKFYTMTNIAGSYLRDLALPLWLKGDYNPEVVRTLPGALPSLLLLAALLAAVIKLRKKAPAAAFGLLLLVTALLPVMNFIPIANIKADRYLYLPLAGWALALTAGAYALIPPKFSRRALFALLAYSAFLGGTAMARNPVFRSELAFFSDAAKGAAPAPRAQVNAAMAHFAAGDAEEARSLFKSALLSGDNYQIRLFWSEMEVKFGSLEEGKRLLAEALPENPESVKALQIRHLIALREAEERRLAGKKGR